MIRLATRADVPAILNIYAPYIRETAITFEYEVPEISEFENRFDSIAAKYPWIVWEEEGKILGYAYADAAFARRAYAWDADLSIYLDKDARGRGVGSRLYGCLEEMLRNLGYCTLYAIITGANEPSRRFHEKRGYVCEGVLKNTGFKLGRWYDVAWYALHLRDAMDPGNAPEAFVCTKEDFELMARYSKEG